MFNNSGRLIKTEKVYYKGDMIEPSKHYKYLGILLDSNGKFKSAMDDLAKKGVRASHNIYKLSTCNLISHETLIETHLTVLSSQWFCFHLEFGGMR